MDRVVDLHTLLGCSAEAESFLSGKTTQFV